MAALVAAAYPGLVDARSISTGANSHQPDASIRYLGAASSFGRVLSPSPWHGRGTFNTTAVGQTNGHTLAGAAPRGARYIYQIAVRNDGTLGQFSVTTSGRGSWPVRYLVGSRDVTARVVAGTYRTRMLATGERVVITVKVWLGRPGTSESRLFSVSSLADGSSRDAVKFSLRYASCGC
jgi:hypothetical protein